MEINKKRESVLVTDSLKEYELSALIDADSFFYALFENDELIKSDEISFQEFSGNDWVAQLPGAIGKGKIGVANPYFTIIPAADYDNVHLSSMVGTAAGNVLINDPIFRSDFIPGLNAYLCYAISSSVIRYCRELMPEFGLCHIVSALIAKVAAPSDRPLLHLCQIGRQNVLIAGDQEGIKIATVLDVHQPLGLLYYTSLAISSLGYNSQDTDVELSGDFTPGHEVATIFGSHFKHLTYRTTRLFFEGKEMNSSSLFFPIRSISLCA